MFVDYIQAGKGFGPIGEALEGCAYDPGLLRPYIDENGTRCVTINAGRRYDKEKKRWVNVYKKLPIKEVVENLGIYSPVFNAASLRKDEWVQLDTAVLRAARVRLRAWADLAAANSFSGFNGMSKLTLEHETMSDPGEAVVDYDGLTESRGDEPRFQLESLPLPIIHSGFYFSQRRLAISRNTGTPLDTTMAEAAARRVAEKIEAITIGIDTVAPLEKDPRHGRNNQVFGYLNFPNRITKSDLTKPTDAAWTPQKTVQDVLAMRDLAYDKNYYGPFILYHSTDWDKVLDDDYSYGGGNNPNQTLRQRLAAIEGITAVRRLDMLRASTHPWTLLLVQMTPEVARAVIGMDFTTVQWESMGGMRLNFKVMAIMVPQLRADYYGNTGIVHGTAP